MLKFLSKPTDGIRIVIHGSGIYHTGSGILCAGSCGVLFEGSEKLSQDQGCYTPDMKFKIDVFWLNHENSSVKKFKNI